MLHVDRKAVHFRDGGITAADSEQRQHREKAGQREQRTAVGLHRRAQATPMLTGTITASTSGKGHCITPMATKVAMAISGPTTARLRNNGRAILATAAIIKHAAAAATPGSLPRVTER